MQTIFDLAISILAGKDVLKVDDNQKFWHTILNLGVKSLNKHDRNAGAAEYFTTKELFSEYMTVDSGQLWNANRRAELDVWPGRIDAFLNIDSEKDKKV